MGQIAATNSPPVADLTKPILLLGAGASVDAGIKDAFAMTGEFMRLFSEDPKRRQQSHALRYVVGGLLMQKGARGEDPFRGVNIEDVFNAMLTLAARQLFEAAPFVAGWHPIVEELDTIELRANVRHEVSETTQHINAATARTIDSALSGLAGRQSHTGRIEVGNEIRKMVEESLRHLRSRVSGGGDQPGEGRIFRATCKSMIQKLISLVWLRSEDASRVEYLRSLVQYAFQTELPIATLNYDTTIEVAAQVNGLRVRTYVGAESTSSNGPMKSITLLKLHGSIDWCSRKDSVGQGVLPETYVVPADEKAMSAEDYTPSVIFGQRNKLTAEGPFLSLLSRFQEQLGRSKELIIIGYSFRDDHINESIAAWFNRDSARRIILVTPNTQWASQSEFAEQLGRFVGPSGRVQVIPQTAAQAIPALFPATPAKASDAFLVQSLQQ